METWDPKFLMELFNYTISLFNIKISAWAPFLAASALLNLAFCLLMNSVHSDSLLLCWEVAFYFSAANPDLISPNILAISLNGAWLFNYKATVSKIFFSEWVVFELFQLSHSVEVLSWWFFQEEGIGWTYVHNEEYSEESFVH